MYQSLMFAVKQRMLDEVEAAFADHPAFSEKVKVYHKFPYDERVQYGVVLRSTSSTQMRMSADNYLAEDISMVRLARQTTHPAVAIEWARENVNALTDESVEDVSGQLGPTQRMFRTLTPILAGPNNLDFADSVGQVRLTVDGIPQLPEFVDGAKGVVVMRRAPAAGSKVVVTYNSRTITRPGMYVFTFVEDNQFIVAPIYIEKGEEVISSTTGTEITVSLDNQKVDPGSDVLYLLMQNGDVPQKLVRGTDYSIVYATGVITFLLPLPTGQRLFANYRWQPENYYNGPFTFKTYQENHDVVPGAVVAIGRRAKKGDQQAVIITANREPQARIYGGHWTMALDFAVVAKDPIQMGEMADQLVNWLWSVRKNHLEYEGLTLNSVEPTGESEETFMESTGDVYYTTSVSVSIQTEWQRFVPYMYAISEVIPDIQLWPGVKEYKVSDTFTLQLEPLVADTREAMKYPILGFERLG